MHRSDLPGDNSPAGIPAVGTAKSAARESLRGSRAGGRGEKKRKRRSEKQVAPCSEKESAQPRGGKEPY
jgi:hypothetical protein